MRSAEAFQFFGVSHPGFNRLSDEDRALLLINDGVDAIKQFLRKSDGCGVMVEGRASHGAQRVQLEYLDHDAAGFLNKRFRRFDGVNDIA